MSMLEIVGLAKLARMVFEGADITPLFETLRDRVVADPADAAARLDLSTILLLSGQRERGLALQAEAIALQSCYRRPSEHPASLTVLAILAPGDMMANTPIDFLLAGGDIDLICLYLAPGSKIPAPLPEHDVAFLAIGESDATRDLLHAIAPLMTQWPRPLLNGRADRIVALTREGVSALMADAPGVLAPRVAKLDRALVDRMAAGQTDLAYHAPRAAYPVIARPAGSHAGAGLEKIEDTSALAAYLADQAGEAFYLSPFVDYAGPDRLFRKQRIVLIEGKPFVCHLAVSPHWMVHYLNAAMTENADNRAAEARFMADFDTDFAARHERAFAALATRIGLDYFGIDCAEAPDGRLLLFEADVAMIVHDMDPPDLFPYKQPQMRKVFDAFQAMLRKAAARG